MAIDIKKQSAQLANASANTVYTAGSVDYAEIKKCTAYNSHTSNVTLTGTTAGLQHVDRIIPAGRTVTLWEIVGESLNTADTITFTPDVAAVINIGLTIKEVTT